MLTEEVQLNRKNWLYALETQPENELRTHGLLSDCGKYCAIGLAATLADIPLDDGIFVNTSVYEGVNEQYGITVAERDEIVLMNDKINYDEAEDGQIINVRYMYTWSDIAGKLREDWDM